MEHPAPSITVDDTPPEGWTVKHIADDGTVTYGADAIAANKAHHDEIERRRAAMTAQQRARWARFCVERRARFHRLTARRRRQPMPVPFDFSQEWKRASAWAASRITLPAVSAPASRPREQRPRVARRSSSSSSSSGSDPGDPDQPPVSLRLAPPARAVFVFGRRTADERGEPGR